MCPTSVSSQLFSLHSVASLACSFPSFSYLIFPVAKPPQTPRSSLAALNPFFFSSLYFLTAHLRVINNESSIFSSTFNALKLYQTWPIYQTVAGDLQKPKRGIIQPFYPFTLNQKKACTLQ